MNASIPGRRTNLNDMKEFSIYRVLRIDGQYDESRHDLRSATAEAVEHALSEAHSNVQYNGEVNGVTVTDITDCGKSA